MGVSERLAKEDRILREIRLALNAFSAVGCSTRRRKGAVYASQPITTGPRLYRVTRRLGFGSPDEFRLNDPAQYRALVLEPNLADGRRFADFLEENGWSLVINPGRFFAKDWMQEHFMSLWRQVIVRYARTVAFNASCWWSTGGAEELLVGIQNKKRLLDADLSPLDPCDAAERIRQSIDAIDEMGYSIKPLYELWRKIILTLEAGESNGT
jgi:hypothetical protein